MTEPDYVAALRAVAQARQTGRAPGNIPEAAVSALVAMAVDSPRIPDATLKAFMTQAAERAVPRHELSGLVGTTRQSMISRLHRLGLMTLYASCPDRAAAQQVTLRDRAVQAAVQGKGLAETARSLVMPRARLRRTLLSIPDGGPRILVALIRNDHQAGRYLSDPELALLRRASRREHLNAVEPDYDAKETA